VEVQVHENINIRGDGIAGPRARGAVSLRKHSTSIQPRLMAPVVIAAATIRRLGSGFCIESGLLQITSPIARDKS
jgi:hypothetical protein